MATLLDTPPHPTGSAEPRQSFSLQGRVVLLASDGSEAANAAAGVAFALAQRYHASVHVVSVVDARSAPIPPPIDFAIEIADAAVGDEVHADQVKEARAIVERAVGAPVDWPVHVGFGSPAGVIVREARRLRAALVLAGLRRHGRLARAFQDETSLHVMRHALCPVLGVTTGLRELPSKALVALDFSQASIAAARATRAIMGEGGTVVLAYSPPVTFELPDDGEAMIHELGVEAGFAKIRTELESGGLKVDRIVLHRTPSVTTAESLLDYADQVQCDLIAVGSARRGRLERWMMGSVSTDIVRDGRHSTLVVPGRRTGRPVTADA